MVELKPKIIVTKTTCACRGPFHQRHQHHHHHHHHHHSNTVSNTSTPIFTPIPTVNSPTIAPNGLPTIAPTATPTILPLHPHQQSQRSQPHPIRGRCGSARLLRRRYLVPHSKMAGQSGPHASRIVRKYRRSRLKRVKRQEYRKLREMVPALHERPKVSKVEVIEEAIKYIDELHAALIQRFRSRGLPAALKDMPLEAHDVHGGNIRELVRHLLASSNPASLPPSRIENARTLPSFIQKISKARRL